MTFSRVLIVVQFVDIDPPSAFHLLRHGRKRDAAQRWVLETQGTGTTARRFSTGRKQFILRNSGTSDDCAQAKANWTTWARNRGSSPGENRPVGKSA
jgi:hypothetical protein